MNKFGFSQRLELRQSQALVMTPQLQQAIKMLQLSNLELADFVEAGCSKFVLRPSCPPAEVIGQIELYANQILPHFN